MSDFTIGVKEWTEQAQAEVNGFLREVGFELALRAVQGTPVDTGFCKAQWHAVLNADPGQDTVAPSGAKGETINPDPPALAIAGFKGGDVLTIYNNCVYVRRLEYGFVGSDSLGRKYNQRPRAWVRQVEADADTIAREVAARLGVTLR